MHYPSTKRSKYSNCIVISCKYLEENQEIRIHHHHQLSKLNSLLWSGPDTIIDACDPIQNPDQTQIIYKPGQTRLTRVKRDPDDLPSFNSGTYYNSHYSKRYIVTSYFHTHAYACRQTVIQDVSYILNGIFRVTLVILCSCIAT